MSKADEIFKKLGYEKTRDNVDCWCTYTKKNEIEISFEKNIQQIFITNLYNSNDEEHRAFERIISINPKLLQAINEKVKELGWNG